MKLDMTAEKRLGEIVAPRVGAWIETGESYTATGSGSCRAPRGRVD
uniref:Uncharacterized protein n=1 Tax=uncultured bacterium contig00101 TaxID=1181568 RepID=A0A806JZ76_9BACT|nr:hypothetical protein [uncultured bacterium contig00101]